MTLDDLRALADKFFVWQEGSGRQTVTTFSALLFAQHVLQLRGKSLDAQNSASTPTLRDAAQQALDWLYGNDILHPTKVSQDLRAALEQAEPEPVAWRTFDGEGNWDYRTYDLNEHYAVRWAERNPRYAHWVEPLYTALVQDQDPELSAALGWPGGISDPVLDRETLLQQVARLVERAHGIKEKE